MAAAVVASPQRDHCEHAGRHHSGGDCYAEAWAAERRDENEQHHARHERLATCLGAECEGVGECNGQHDRETGDQCPTDVVHHRCDGALKLRSDEVELEFDQSPRLAGRQQPPERRPILPGEQQPQAAKKHDGNGQPARDAKSTQHQRPSVSECDE